VNNEVTLEELNKPTDTELASLRRLASEGALVDVSLGWYGSIGNGLTCGTLTVERLDQWIKELQTERIEEDHDEHMIRVRLDEGY
jgi:hypothetical protein